MYHTIRPPSPTKLRKDKRKPPGSPEGAALVPRVSIQFFRIQRVRILSKLAERVGGKKPIFVSAENY